MDAARDFDLDGYLARIGYRGPQEASEGVLRAVHLGHVGAIPFENLDVLLGRPIGLDLESLQAKLVRSRRGGYCFEQNTLLAAALRAMGFTVDTLEARVRPPGVERLLPRTHMVLQVTVGGRPLLADVGFGGDGPLEPVPLDGTVAEQPGDSFRTVDDGAVTALQIRRPDGWQDLYAFGPVPAHPIDFEVANHFTATHPSSPFRATLTAQRSRPGERQILRGRTFTMRRGSQTTVRELAEADVVPLLRDTFGIELPPDTPLPTPPTT